MLNNFALSTPGGNFSREDSPWRRLPYTGPSAVIGWLLALSALPYLLQHVNTVLLRTPAVEARIVELPPPPKPVPAPPAAAVPPQAKPQTRPEPEPHPVQQPQKHAEPIAPAQPVAEQAPAPVSAVQEDAPPAAAAQTAQQTSTGAVGQTGSAAEAGTTHGINVRTGAIGVVEHQHHFDSPANGSYIPPDASIYNEEAIVLYDGVRPAYGTWHQEYSAPCDPVNTWDQSCKTSTYFQPTAPWCYNNDPIHSWNMGTCQDELARAVTAYKRKDYTSAFAQFKKLAEKEYSPAESNLAAMYSAGLGVAKDDQQAVFWWRKAAKENDPKAVYNLAMAYSDGKGVDKDDKQAVYWFRKAAYMGSNFAQYNLAVMYALGKGTERDDKQALYWYRKSAGLGNPDAAYNLGVMYERGVGVPKGGKEVVYWYCKGATRGSKEALESLAYMYADGADRPNYHAVAYACWLFGLPTRSNLATAELERENIERPLTQEQRDRAHVAARTWLSREWVTK
jgi:TPR repeat protein